MVVARIRLLGWTTTEPGGEQKGVIIKTATKLQRGTKIRADDIPVDVSNGIAANGLEGELDGSLQWRGPNNNAGMCLLNMPALLGTVLL